MTLRKEIAPSGAHSLNMSAYSVTAEKLMCSDIAAFSDAQKICAPQHAKSHDKSVFSDTARKSAFSDP